jgi:YD repeat-containing protein
VLRIDHPDGTAESFTYNTLGQVLTHTDGKGQTTRLLRTARGLHSSRQDAKGQRIRYEYDKAIRLTALVNENNAAYQFAYDASDRLIEEKRIDNLTRRFRYNLGGHLTRVDETGYGDRAERPQRSTEFERDVIGRLLAKINQDARQDYTYDEVDRLLSIARLPTSIGTKLGVGEENPHVRIRPPGPPDHPRRPGLRIRSTEQPDHADLTDRPTPQSPVLRQRSPAPTEPRRPAHQRHGAR